MKTLKEDILLKVEEFNNNYQREKGISPSFRQIMNALSLGSLATVQRYVKELERRGRLKRTDIGNIEVMPQFDQSKTVNIPIVGKIACGQPTFAVENIEGSFSFPYSILGNGTFFGLYATGDSMIDVGIREGDLLIIRQEYDAPDGAIVVAMVDGNVTLKKLYHKGDKLVLHPENKEMADIVINSGEVEIQGVLVSRIRIQFYN